MPVEIKNLSIKVHVNGKDAQIRQGDNEPSSRWSQTELISLIEKSLKNQKER